MSERLSGLRDVSLSLTIAATVLASAPQLNSSFGIPKVIALATGSSASLTFALLARLKSNELVRNAPSGLLGSPWPPAGILLIATAVSTMTSISWRISLTGQYNRYGGLVTLLSCIALLAAISIGGNRRTATAVIVTIAVSTTIAATYAAAQSVGIEPVAWRATDGTAAFSTFGNSTFMGAAAGIGLVASFSAALLTRVALRPLWILPAVLFVSAAAGARSNGFVLAFGAGSLLFAWSARRVVGPWPLRIAVTTGAIVAALSVAGLVAPALPGPAGLAGSAIRESMGPRSEYWNAGLRAFLARPLSGWGPDTFAQVFPRYRSAYHAANLGRLTDKIHNVPLERFAESGFVAGIAFLMLIAQGLFAGLKPPRLRKDSILLAGGTGVLAAYFAQSLVSIDTPALAVFMWTGLGVIQCTRGKHRERVTQMSPWLLKSGAVVTGFATIAALAIGVRLWRADSEFARAIRSPGPAIAERNRYEKAIAENPWEARYRIAWGIVLAEEARRNPVMQSEAISMAESAVTLEPGNPYSTFRLGRLYEQLAKSAPPGSIERAGHASAAIAWYLRTLELNPGEPQTEQALCEAKKVITGQTGDCEGSP